MSLGETVGELAMALAAELTTIGLGQATLVALDSVARPQDVLVTAVRGFTLVCPQAGGVRSASTEVTTKRHARQRWFS